MSLPTRPSRIASLAGLTLLAGLAAGAHGLGNELAAPLSVARPDPHMRALIDAFERGDRRASHAMISIRGHYEQPVYLATAPCCDLFNGLYDREGRYVCAPTGGFSGAGDGKCLPWAQMGALQRRLRVPSVPPNQQPWPPESTR